MTYQLFGDGKMNNAKLTEHKSVSRLMKQIKMLTIGI
jgi:hypothetical protein